MSRVISFRTDDEIAEVIDRVVEETDEDVSRALVTKRLVEEAVDARERPLWLRVGLSDRRAAQIEALRREGETEEDLARELFAEALEARDRDVLDAIGASDELREEVEEHREDGESLDGAVERLLREGVEVTHFDEDVGARARSAGLLGALMLVCTSVTAVAGVPAMIAVTAVVVAYLVMYPRLDAAAAALPWT